MAAALTGCAALACVTVWFFAIRDARSPLEIEYATLNPAYLSDASKTNEFSSINLLASTFRDAASVAAHSRAGLTDVVLFRLTLARPEPESEELGAFISDGDDRVFEVPNARVFRTPYGSELRFVVPKQVLKQGNYEAGIIARDGRYSGVVYHFRIN